MADLLKFKLALTKTRRPPRTGLYGSELNTTPDKYGLIASKEDYELGVPNLKRREDITLIASNSIGNKQTLRLKLKWRPDSTGELVTQLTHLQLINAHRSVYEYKQIETYKPVEVAHRPGRILQYGSNGSQLKLQIGAPYRRMRLFFRGQMKLVGGANEQQFDELIFVRINAVICPISKIFDFYHQFNADCFKLSYTNNKPAMSYAAAIENLLYQDRHEQLVRFRGEIVVERPSDESAASLKSVSFFWGFYSRHFIADTGVEAAPSKQTETKRILAHLDNGQMWHVGQNKIDDNIIDFGYTCLEIISVTYPIEKPSEVDWNSIGNDTKEFKIKIFGEEREFEYTAKRRIESANIFDLSLDTNKGWAWICTDETGQDSADDLAAIETNYGEFQQNLTSGLLCKSTLLPKSVRVPSALVVNLVEPACSHSDLVGSKASSLAHLKEFTASEHQKECRYTVPQAFAVTRFAHDQILAGNAQLRDAIERLQQLVSAGELSRLQSESEAIQKRVADITLPSRICQELGAKMREVYGDRVDQVAFAVRSSSWGEDEEGMSAAGQLRTLLGVRGLESIYRAVMKCFASKFSYENLEYKRQHGLPLDLPMAVVVQEMVACEKAGVMFTCDPTSGNDAIMTITANYGLGESVVSGQSDPDTIRVRYDGANGNFKIDKIDVGLKKIVIDGTGNESSENNYDRSKCCLSEEETLKLAKCGRELAKYFQSMRDIEWGYLGDTLYLFQSRPVTGLATWTDEELIHEIDMPSRAEIDFYTRANVGEVMPYAASPLSLTYSVHMWNVTGFQFNKRLAGPQVPKLPPYVSFVVTYEYYHSFLTLRNNSFLALRQGQEKTLMGRAMEIGLFGHEIDERPDIMEATKYIKQLPNLFEGFRFKLHSAPLRWFTMSTILKQKKLMIKLREQVTSLKLAKSYSKNKLRGLYEQFYAVSSVIMEAWFNHILVIALAGESNMMLMTILSKFIQDPIQLFSALSKFLGASPNVISAEIPQRISDMANIIKAKGREETERFIAMSTEQARNYIEKDEKLKEEYATFLRRFGHRCYNEFELESKSWREDPAITIDMLKANCKSAEQTDQAKDTNAVLGTHNKQSPEQILDSLGIKGLDSKLRAHLTKSVIPRCQLMVAAREQTKDILIDHTDIQREVTRMMGRELRSQMRLPDEDLLYYLFYDELEPLLENYQPNLIMQAQRRRNMFKKHFSELWKFDEVIQGAEIVPNHLKQERELNEKLANAPKLHGTPASSGRVRGRVCLVDGYKELNKVRPGNILLTHSTDIGFSPVFPMILGIITEVGGLISHGAVVAREYGLPSVLGIPEVTRILQDGEEIILDANNGTIIRLSLGGEEEPNGATVVDEKQTESVAADGAAAVA